MSKIITLIKKSISLGDILVFPEMTLTGFTMNASSMAEGIKGDSLSFFSSLAIEYRVHVFAGFIEKSGSHYFNTLVHVASNGIVKSRYRKIHPFSYSSEDKFYKRGNRIVITEVNKYKIGLSICYDLRFPELFRFYAKERVDLIINIANWPVDRIEHWRTLLKARAIENQCYVAGVNRVGRDPKLFYNGFSSVFDPMGKELISLKDKEQILMIEVDRDIVKKVKTNLPFLKDIKLI